MSAQFDFDSLEQALNAAGDASSLSRSDMRDLQEKLADAGLYSDARDYADGIAGPMTNHAISLLDEDYAREYLTGMAMSDNEMSRQDIMMMQAAFNRLGLGENTLEIDGKFGPRTAEALQGFLTDNHDTAANLSPSLKEKYLRNAGSDAESVFVLPLPRPRPDVDTADVDVEPSAQADLPPIPRARPSRPEPEETEAPIQPQERVLLPELAPPISADVVQEQLAAERMANRPEPRPLEERPYPLPPLITSLEPEPGRILLNPDLIDRMNADPEVMGHVATTYKYAEIHGVDPHLLANQFWQESRFNDNAISLAGAKGIAQMMPGTGAQYGLRGSEFMDAEKSIEAGARYMADLSESFGPDLALVAYNGGSKALEFVENNINGDVTIDGWMDFMTARAETKNNDSTHPGAWHNETREYVEIIHSAYWPEEQVNEAIAKPENMSIASSTGMTALDAINTMFPTDGAASPQTAMGYAPSIQNLMKSDIAINIDNMLGIHFGNAANGIVPLVPEAGAMIQLSHQNAEGPDRVRAHGMGLMM